MRGQHRGGRWLLPAPGPQPPLGFGTKTGLISDLLICMVAFWVRGIEPFCSALLCPVLQRPHIGLIRGDCFQEPCSARPRGDACILVLPWASVLGSGFRWAVWGDFAEPWGCSLYTTWPTYNTKALLYPRLP